MLFVIINFTFFINLVILVFFYFVKSFTINLCIFFIWPVISYGVALSPNASDNISVNLVKDLSHRSLSFHTPPLTKAAAAAESTPHCRPRCRPVAAPCRHQG
jgi:hypothetical protein